jgi:polyisoprenoid-binding protein YceI
MKNPISKKLLFSVFVLLITSSLALAQKEPTTSMSYKVDFGPVYPIDGNSHQLVAKLSLDDVTGKMQELSFKVPLLSFIGSHGGYLAWLGNSWYNPDMNFHSGKVVKKDDHWEVTGQLEFRRKFKPVTIKMYRKDVDGEIVLEGAFQMNTRDYFITPPPLDLVPAYIPFKMTMVFDKPEEVVKNQMLSSH